MPPATPPAPSRDDQLLAAAARQAQREGRKPSREQARGLARVERQLAEHYGLQYVQAVPKRDYAAWSGRQQKIANEQAIRYGLPIGRATISLPELVRWLHDAIAAGRLQPLDAAADDLLAGAASPWQERYRRERTLLARLERRQRERDLLPRAKVHECLGRFAGLLRSAGEKLQRQFGSDALEILTEALDGCQREIDACFVRGGDPADGDDDGGPDDLSPGALVDAPPGPDAEGPIVA